MKPITMKKCCIIFCITFLIASCGGESAQKQPENAGLVEQKATAVAEGNKIDRPAYSLTYPSNWKIDSADADFSYDSYFTIEGEEENFISVFIFNNSLDPAKAVEQQVQTFSADHLKNPEISTFTKWGKLEGIGKLLKGKVMGVLNGEVKIFSYAKGENTFLMVEQYFTEDVEKNKPGFDMIENSFTIK